jgi:hypothetical protein
MTRTQELQEQAARAERLARRILDTITIERLTAFAAECRSRLAALQATEPCYSKEAPKISPAANERAAAFEGGERLNAGMPSVASVNSLAISFRLRD